MERIKEYQTAIHDVLQWVFDYEKGGVPIIKEELVEVVKSALNHKSVSPAHTVIDMMVAMQYLNVEIVGNRNYYTLTFYGARLMSAYAEFFEGKRQVLYG
jgi:predicted transcriptional regulator